MAKYDLVALWEQHCKFEFETRDVNATMATMVERPYVNHIPTLTGISLPSLYHSSHYIYRRNRL